MTQSALISLAVIALALVFLALGLWKFSTWSRSSNRSLQKLLDAISTDMLINFVIPDGTGGEIFIDHLLLTHRGLVLLETKDTQGAVFAGDRMDTWTAIHRGSRFTFKNPIPMLQDRKTAIGLLAPGIPVDSRVLFFNNKTTFPKGHPVSVTTVPVLMEEYEMEGNSHSTQDFSPHWQAIKSAATT